MSGNDKHYRISFIKLSDDLKQKAKAFNSKLMLKMIDALNEMASMMQLQPAINYQTNHSSSFLTSCCSVVAHEYL